MLGVENCILLCAPRDEYRDEVDIFCFQDLLFGNNADFTPKRGGRIKYI